MNGNSEPIKVTDKVSGDRKTNIPGESGREGVRRRLREEQEAERLEEERKKREEQAYIEKREQVRRYQVARRLLREDEERRSARERAERERLERELREKEEKERAEKERLAKERARKRREKKLKKEKERRIRAIEAEERRRKEAEEKQALSEAEHRSRVEQVTSMELPMDWSGAFDLDERASVHTDSIPDGLIRSLTTLGRVDIEFISSITGEDCAAVIKALRGSIYQDPEQWDEVFYKGWVVADEYLSGNLWRKLRKAVEANEYYLGYFEDNVGALKKALPQAASAGEIYATLGSPWIPTDVIDDFILYLFDGPAFHSYAWNRPSELAVKHNEVAGIWEIPEKTRYAYHVKSSDTYGVEGLNALHIMEDTLNMIPVRVTKEVPCGKSKSGKKRVVDKEKTIEAAEKQRLMTEEFKKWVWSDSKRRERLESIFEERYGCIRRRVFDGSFLDFPGMSEDVSLYPYQKNAVARILFSPNTLLAHDVGAGKTYEMIAAGQELRRMGLSKKNMYVVPNNIVGQWESIFRAMYPDAVLLCVEPGTFKPDKRAGVLESIRDDDFDGIIIAYSCFEMIPVSREYLAEEIEEKQRELGASMADSRRRTKGLDKRSEGLAKAKEEIFSLADPELVCFDELGVTRLFVDEAHNFKNVPISTKTGNVHGISRTGSKKCRDMMTKVHMVQKNNGGGGVIFATGTPITNSVTDAFIMQKYLQEGELALLDIANFDAWIGMFAEKTTEFEIDVDTGSYRLATRFAKFHNLPELTSLLASFADFYSVADSEDMPSADGRIDTVTGRSRELADYLEEISARAESVRNGTVSRRDDNMLKITTDGRKAALDIRLVKPDAANIRGTKTALCADNAAKLYFRYAAESCAQLIFCDSSTPKAGFNIYDELKRELVLRGVPEKEIAYVHDADTEAKREKLFEKVRLGKIRVLIGSTFKLGLGVNVQDRLIALHHIDVPWRPADMTQREGRILRRGNMNKKVFIYRYITEGSFDSYSWQLLETKQRFICDLLSGSICERSGSDIENTVLDYAEVKALAVGSPLLKERVQAANELSRLRMLQKGYVESRIRLERELAEIPAKRSGFEENLRRSEEDRDFYAEWKKAHPPAEEGSRKAAEAEARKALRERFGEALRNNALAREDSVFTVYRGFEIVLPANMSAEKPYITLRRAGTGSKHFVGMGDNDAGNLIRVDNYLEKLGDHCDKLRAGIMKLDRRESEIREELARDEGYSRQIEHYKNKVESLDRKLGVGKI